MWAVCLCHVLDWAITAGTASQLALVWQPGSVPMQTISVDY